MCTFRSEVRVQKGVLLAYQALHLISIQRRHEGLWCWSWSWSWSRSWCCRRQS